MRKKCILMAIGVSLLTVAITPSVAADPPSIPVAIFFFPDANAVEDFSTSNRLLPSSGGLALLPESGVTSIGQAIEAAPVSRKRTTSVSLQDYVGVCFRPPEDMNVRISWVSPDGTAQQLIPPSIGATAVTSGSTYCLGVSGSRIRRILMDEVGRNRLWIAGATVGDPPPILALPASDNSVNDGSVIYETNLIFEVSGIH